MTFHFSQFLDSALGQLVGCFLAMMVILLVRDNSQARTGRVLLNQFVSAAVSSLTTNTRGASRTTFRPFTSNCSCC